MGTVLGITQTAAEPITVETGWELVDQPIKPILRRDFTIKEARAFTALDLAKSEARWQYFLTKGRS